MIKPIFEFLMWDNCRNDCCFCYQKQQYSELSLEQQKASIECVRRFLLSDQYIKGSHILLVGGEIFDTPRVHDYVNELVDFIVEMMIKDEIDLFYINTNLIYKNLVCVEYLISKLDNNNLLPRLKFTTSYDLKGRFKTDKVKDLMLSNLMYLTTKYQNLNVVVNIMLTNAVCDALIEGRFNMAEFCQQYRCDINTIPYIVLNDSLSASRYSIFKALSVINGQIPGYVKRYVANFDLPQDKILHRYNAITDTLDGCTSDNSDCGHSVNFKKYSTNHTCFVCDLKTMFEDYE